MAVQPHVDALQNLCAPCAEGYDGMCTMCKRVCAHAMMLNTNLQYPAENMVAGIHKPTVVGQY
jgi:hypothetical protein